MDSPTQRAVNEALECLARDGKNESAWLDLHRILRPYVHAICARWLGNSRGLAEDAAQEVFLKLARFAPLGKLAESGNIYPYLRMVCRSVCIDIFHRARDARAFENAADAASQSGGLELLDAKLFLDQLRRQLGRDDAKLLELCLIGHTTGEIAKLCGWTYAAAGVRIHRLKRRLYALSGESDKPT